MAMVVQAAGSLRAQALCPHTSRPMKAGSPTQACLPWCLLTWLADWLAGYFTLRACGYLCDFELLI